MLQNAVLERVYTAGYVDGVQVQIPKITIRGHRPGKTLVVVTAQHGREVSGIAAIYRAMGMFNPADMSGTVVLFPVASPLCVRAQMQDFPFDYNRSFRAGPDQLAMNINRQWPGDANGSLPQRIAQAIWTNGIETADAILDIHGWGSTCTPLAWAQQPYEELLMASAFPWIEVRPPEPDLLQQGMLEQACWQRKIPCVVCELTPQDVVNPAMVAIGLRAISNIARHMGIIRQAPDRPAKQVQIDHRQNISVVSEKPGLVVSRFVAGDVIEANEVAVELLDLDALECIQRAVPPRRMLLHTLGQSWGTGQLSYSVVRAGETIATFSHIVREIGE